MFKNGSFEFMNDQYALWGVNKKYENLHSNFKSVSNNWTLQILDDPSNAKFLLGHVIWKDKFQIISNLLE